ncbi:hypothetical protein [Nonlabens ulvanivorans]|uniref:hypothetical protein n=1 Tax=Nonlabens ulvanivorans TaxID=906888 RepID=UPI0037C93D6D
MKDDYSWLEKTTPRSVSQMRPWPENPRLDPDLPHSVIKDYVEDLITDNGERESFLMLIKRIAEKGFIHLAPMVVWKNESSNKYFVAEGNRRLLALKLLLKPTLSPTSIRSRVEKYSRIANLKELEKIKVSVAPSLEAAEYFISERNSSASTIRPWSREAQQRWILQLYDKYNGNAEKILNASNFTMPYIKSIIRILTVRDYVKLEVVKSHLTEEEYKSATSHRFKMTVLERFLNSTYFRDTVGLHFEDTTVEILSVKSSFYFFYSQLIKKIIYNQIDTRFTVDDIQEILETLPQVKFPDEDILNEDEDIDTALDNKNTFEKVSDDSSEDETQDSKSTSSNQPIKEDRNRRQVIMSIYHINSSENRIVNLFNELKKIPVKRYPNHCSVSLRVFLDLVIIDYLRKNELIEDLMEINNGSSFDRILLKKRCQFLLSRMEGKARKVLQKLLNHSNEYSLDQLNSYVHSTTSHHVEPGFINGFWDFLFPLIIELVTIEED